MRKDRDERISVLRTVAGATVKKLEPHCGSRMVAYEKIAEAIDVSASWVRKFVTVEGSPEPPWSVGCLMMKYYDDVCAHLDLAISDERKQIIKLLGELNAPDPPSHYFKRVAAIPLRAGGDRIHQKR